MKNFFIRFISFILTHVPMPEHIRDIFMWPLASRVLGLKYSTPIDLCAGFTIKTFLDDQLGRLALFYGIHQKYFWEPSTTQLLERLVVDTNHIVVAGSHIGVTALYARKAMKAGGVIHTFEPIPYLYEVAKGNFMLNAPLGTIKISKLALGDTPGTVTMTKDRIRSRIVPSGTHPKGLDTEEVAITTIDSYCNQNNIPRLDLVFLDVEGYELKALMGMQKLLATTPPRDIIYEISFPYKDDLRAARELESFLAPFGYRFFIIEDAYDPTYYTEVTPPLTITKTSPEVYEKHRSLRYFNVYATLQSDQDLSQLGI